MHRVGLDIVTGLTRLVARGQITRHKRLLHLAVGYLITQRLLHETGQALAFTQHRFGSLPQGVINPKRGNGSGFHGDASCIAFAMQS